MNWIEFIFGHEIWHWALIGVLVIGGVLAIVELPGRVGMAIGGTLLAAAVGVVAYDAGFRAAHQSEYVADLKAQIQQKTEIIAEREKEAESAAQIAERNRERADEEQALAETLQEKVDAYVAKLQPNDPCVATDADVRFMRSLGADGHPAARPAAPAGKVR